MMKNFIVALAIGLFSTMAVSQINTEGLTSSQIEQLHKQAKEMAAAAKNPAVISAGIREEASAWGELGTNMGKAMTAAAAELGVAASEFSQTGLGKVVVFIVAFKIIGKELLDIIMSVLAGAGIIGMGVWFLRTYHYHDVTYEYKPYLWGFWQRSVPVSVSSSSDAAVATSISGIIAVIIGAVIIATAA